MWDQVCHWGLKYLGAVVSLGTETRGSWFVSGFRNMRELVCQWGPIYVGDGVTAGTEICDL